MLSSTQSSSTDRVSLDPVPAAVNTPTPASVASVTAIEPRTKRFAMRSSWLRRVRSLLTDFLTRWVTDTQESSSPSHQRFWGGEKKRRRGRPEETKGAGSRSV